MNKAQVQRLKRLLIGTGTLGAGNLAAQVLRLTSTLIILAMYTRDAFGLYAVFFSYVNILITVNSLAYPAAIPNMTGQDVPKLALGSIWLAIISSLLIWLLYGLAGYPHAAALALYCLAYAVYRTFDMLSLRAKAFSAMAVLKLVQPVTMLLCLAWIYYHGNRNVTELIWSQVIAGAAAAISFFASARSKMESRGVKIRAVIEALKRERSWPLLMAPSEFMGNLGYFLPVILIEYFIGAGSAGEYGLVLRLCLGPIMVLSHSATQVYHAEFSQARRMGEAHAFNRVRYMNFVIGIAGIIVAILIGLILPVLVEFLYPGKYLMTGTLSVLLAPMFGFMLFVMPMETAFLAFSRLDLLFASQVVNLAATLTCFGYIAPNYGLVTAAGLYSAVQCARFSAEYVLAKRVLQGRIIKNTG
ncbi:MAG: hypothetical protein GXP49_05725 [Deltaproteobacteria bacterium]|nr:hypothetical protein [Deltaproteobacteria bacterium]